MRETVLVRLERDHVAAMRVADSIERTLSRASTKRDLEASAYDVIDFHDRVIRRHVALQEDTLLAVAAEHFSAKSGVVLREAQVEVEVLEDRINGVRRDIELGEPLRLALEASELAIRDFVNFEQSVLLPWARQHVGSTLLRALESRVEAGPTARAHGALALARDLIAQPR
jgi:hemerythrin-like domain-containing protein